MLSLQPTRSSVTRASGFTLIEILVVVILSTTIVTALGRFIVAGHPLSRITFLQARSTEVARVQLERLAKTIREARPSDTGAYPLAEMSPQRIIFYANIDGDAQTERVRYELVGTELRRGIIKPSGTPLVYNAATETVNPVARSVRNGATPIFTYYTGNYPADTTPLTPVDLTEVKYIQFHLVIDADTALDPPAVDVVSQVQLRNLKTNLGETDD